MVPIGHRYFWFCWGVLLGVSQSVSLRTLATASLKKRPQEGGEGVTAQTVITGPGARY